MPKAAPARLSVCMIVRDEAAVLARCLDSLQGLYDELCIVDTGSRDATPDIARRYGARLQQLDSCNGEDGKIIDFAAARNAALAMASGDWVLQIDADEVLSAGHALVRRQLRAASADMLGVTLRSDGAQWISGRLFRRMPGARYRSRIHEYLEHDGSFARLPRIVIDNLQHKAGKESSAERNIRLLQLAIADEPDEARGYHYLGNEYREAQRFGDAIDCYRAALSKDNYQLARFHMAYYLGICHLLQGQWHAALDAAFLALRTDPRYAEAPCLLGDIYSGMGELAYARQWYRSALAVGRPPADAVMGIQHWAYAAHPKRRLAALQSPAAAG